MATNPSFSSILLEKIYRSIDEGDRRRGEMNFPRETMETKQKMVSVKCNRGMEEVEELETFRMDKWMEKERREKLCKESDRKWQRHRQHVDHDQDSMLFSSTCSSSDSSSGGFSPSDTESMYRMKSTATCFGPRRPKPVQKAVPARSLRQSNLLDDYLNSSISQKTSKQDESFLKKSRSLKIYNDLKKMKQPNSPGGRLTSFLNSLFTATNVKKTKTASSVDSTCSSASSFSRSLMRKHSPTVRGNLRDGVEISKAFSHKDSTLLTVSVPTPWKTGRSSERNEDELKLHVEATGKAFLKNYHETQKKNDFILRNLLINKNLQHQQTHDDDASSCSSSDLFELDQSSVMGNHRYYQELPVYETTHVGTNHAIANGLIRSHKLIS